MSDRLIDGPCTMDEAIAAVKVAHKPGWVERYCYKSEDEKVHEIKVDGDGTVTTRILAI